jgi:hypothetical protein
MRIVSTDGRLMNNRRSAGLVAVNGPRYNPPCRRAHRPRPGGRRLGQGFCWSGTVDLWRNDNVARPDSPNNRWSRSRNRDFARHQQLLRLRCGGCFLAPGFFFSGRLDFLPNDLLGRRHAWRWTLRLARSHWRGHFNLGRNLRDRRGCEPRGDDRLDPRRGAASTLDQSGEEMAHAASISR